MGTSYGGVDIQYNFSFSKKDLKRILNHVFNHLNVCGEDFNKSPEFHKKKIIKDLNYSNQFSFKNFGFCIFFVCEKRHFCDDKNCNKNCVRREIIDIDIGITKIFPFLFLTKKEKIDFNNFLKYFKKFNKMFLNDPDCEGSMEPTFIHKNSDFLLNLDEKAISKAGWGYDDAKKGIALYGNFFEATLYFKCDKKEFEKVIQNFFKDFKILSACNPKSFEKIKIPKSFLKSEMRINFRFNKLPMYVEFYKYDKEGEYKNLEDDFSIEFGFSFERDIREANENRKKLFNKHFKELKKLSHNFYFHEEWEYVKDYFKKTLFDENGFRIGGFENN